MRFSLASIIVVAALALISTPSQAQPGIGGLPNGSYLQSCESVAIRGSGYSATLVAQCRAQNGSLRGSTLRYRDCQSTIENVDGRLTCAMGEPEWRQPTSTVLPSGNYVDTCRGAITRGYGAEATLSAQCQMRDGRWRSSNVRYGDCRSGIENVDGQLTCALPGQPGPVVNRQEAPPPGDYWQTCQNLVINGYGQNASMTAQCQARDGRVRTSSLNYKNCRGPVENVDGQLRCDDSGYRPPYNGNSGQGGYGYNQGGYGSGGYNGGGYGETITLFDGANFGGQPFTSDREVTNLPREYNDRAMSLRVGRSVWQVCTDSDFRGHCETFDRDVRDLRQYGMERGVSSMRPVQ